MAAGKSGTTFTASDSVTVTVKERPVIIEPKGDPKYEIRNYSKGDAITNGNEKNPQIIGYEAIGQLWFFDGFTWDEKDSRFDFELTQKNDNLKSPQTINGIPVYLG